MSPRRDNCLYAVVLACAVLLLAALTSLLRQAQSCGCEQTFMYTSYTEVPLLDPRWSKHRYKLRLYREQAMPRQALPPSGHPALLIPGNAGSYEQVRSLASETARLTDRARAAASGQGSSSSIPEIDWYTLDLLGELSAFDGHLLEEQVHFALACLKQLQAMYGSTSGSIGGSAESSGGAAAFDLAQLPAMLRPSVAVSAAAPGSSSGMGLLLVGHSMGGVVARATAAAAWAAADLGPGSISLLLTLASPHVATPLMLQPRLARFYDSHLAAPLPPALPAVSLHGGGADMQVSPLLSWLPPAQQLQQQQRELTSSSYGHAASMSTAGAADQSANSSSGSIRKHIQPAAGAAGALRITQSTAFMPGVWLQAGHTQIDWCNQLTRRLSAALLEVCAQHQQHQQHQQQSADGTFGHQRDGRALLWQSQHMRRVQKEQNHMGWMQQSAGDRLEQQHVSTRNGTSAHQAPAHQQFSTALGTSFWLGSFLDHAQDVVDGPFASTHQAYPNSSRRSSSSNSNRQAWLHFTQQRTNDPDQQMQDQEDQQQQHVDRKLLSSSNKSGSKGISASVELQSGLQQDAAAAAAAAAASYVLQRGDVVGDVLQHFLTSYALSALEDDLGLEDLLHQHHQQQQHQQRQQSTQTDPQQQLEQQLEQETRIKQQQPGYQRRRRWRQRLHRHRHRTTGTAAGPAGHQHHQQHRQQDDPGRQLLQQQARLHMPASSSSSSPAAAAADGSLLQQQLLLLLSGIMPADVLIADRGPCPLRGAPGQQGSDTGPGWYVTREAAVSIELPHNTTTYKARPSAGTAGRPADAAAAAAEQLGGAVYFWEVPAASRTTAAAAGAATAAGDDDGSDVLMLLSSGAQPCSGFRVWLQRGSVPGDWVDVTALAAPLPTMQDELVLHVRDFEKWLEVIQGRDYLAPAAWTLALHLGSHASSATAATAPVRVAVWLAPSSTSTARRSDEQQEQLSSSNITVAAAASLTMQWISQLGGGELQRQPHQGRPAQYQHHQRLLLQHRDLHRHYQHQEHLDDHDPTHQQQHPQQQQHQQEEAVPVGSRASSYSYSSSSSSSSKADAAVSTAGGSSQAGGEGVGLQSSSSTPAWPEVSLGPFSLLRPVQRLAGGSMLLHVVPQQQWLWQVLALKVVLHKRVPKQQLAHDDNSSRNNAGCWQPVAMYRNIWASLEHAVVVNTTLDRSSSSSSSSSSSQFAASLRQQLLHPWLTAFQKVSSMPGTAAATSRTVPLSEVSRAEGSLLLVLDPECGYSLYLVPDVVGPATQLLLSHASAAAGMAVALLLLVLSHQMSSLVRVMSVARHGTLVPPGPFTAGNAFALPAVAMHHAGAAAAISSSKAQKQLLFSHQQGVSSSSRSRDSAAARSSSSLLGLPSPAAAVARRLVSSTPGEGQEGADSDSTDMNSAFSSSSSGSEDHELLLPRHGRQQQKRLQLQPQFSGNDADPDEAYAADIEDNSVGGSAASDGFNVPAGVRQASLIAMQRLRRQITVTLGGAPPPVSQQLASAAAATMPYGRGGNRRSGRRRLQHQHSTTGSGWSQGIKRYILLGWPWAGGFQGSSRSNRGAENNNSSRMQDFEQEVGGPQRGNSSQVKITSWGGAGISVLGSLVAVTRDARVLLLAGLMAAAASGLNCFNPSSMWYYAAQQRHQQEQGHLQQHDLVSSPSLDSLFSSEPVHAVFVGGGDDASGSSITASSHAGVSNSGAAGICSWLLQHVLLLLGLQQRGDSPGVVGAGVLLGMALLVLLLAVGLSLGLKWMLDYVSSAIAAFNRSLIPDQAVLDAVARASQGGSLTSSSQPPSDAQHTALSAASTAAANSPSPSSSSIFLGPSLCSCALCAAGQALCGHAAAAAASAALQAGGFCGLTASCLNEASAAVGLHADGNSSSSVSSSQPQAAAGLPPSGRATPDVAPLSPAPQTMSGLSTNRKAAAAVSSMTLAVQQLKSADAATGHAAAPAQSATGIAAPGGPSGGNRQRSRSFSDLRVLLAALGSRSPSPVKQGTRAPAAAPTAAAVAVVPVGPVGSAGGAASVPWWLQRRSQMLAVVLVLLAVANLALGLCGAVLLLFFTWHLPSSSIAAGTRVAGLLLGSRGSSRANTRTSSPVPLAAPSAGAAAAATTAAAAAAAATAGGSSGLGRCQQPGQMAAALLPRVSEEVLIDMSAAGAATAASSEAVSSSSGSSQQDGGAEGSSLVASSQQKPPLPQRQQQRLRVRSSAGLPSWTAHAAAQQQQQQQQGEGQDGDSESLDTDSPMQPLARLGTINSLLLREHAHRAAAAEEGCPAAACDVTSQLQAPASTQHDQQQQQQQRDEAFFLSVAGQEHASAQQKGAAAAETAQHDPDAGFGRSSRPPALALPPLDAGGHHQQQQQQQQVMVHVATRVDAAGARALALHQLTCHMCHAWLLLYGCCCVMLLPSLLAWLKLPLGQQHMSHPWDVLVLSPVLLHCVAIAAGKVDALVGFGPATAAATWRSAVVRGFPSPAALDVNSSSANKSIAGDAAANGADPVNLHKLVVRAAAAYMFAAALMGQAVRWIDVVALVALLMLAGRQAVEGWHRLHRLLFARRQDLRAKKHKGK